MKTLITILVLALAASGAVAQSGIDGPNAIGVYIAPPTSPEGAGAFATYIGPMGVVEAYAVLTEAMNLDVGGTGGSEPILNVGGFEFRIESTEDVVLLTSEFPAGANAINFMTPPNFYVGCNIPVTGWATVLVNLQFLWTSTDYCDFLYLAPVYPPNVQSIPGMMAITDANDEFRLNPAFPSSGDFEAPVFTMGCGDDAEDASWGEIKSLYR
jgi:hypothetical protein